MSGERTRVHLVRHGEVHNPRGVLYGRLPDYHLSEAGVEMARRVALRLKGRDIVHLASSPMERAQETAQPLAEQLGLEIQIHAGVGEIQFGEWTGRTIKELADSPIWTNIQRFPSGTRIPGGETLREMQNRVVDALEALRAAHPNDIIAIFAHADVVKAMVAHYLGVHLDLFQRIIISPASVSIVSVGDSGPHVLCVNDTGVPPKFPDPKPAAAEGAAAGDPASDAEITPETERPVG